jgi:hypothetical protein
VAQQLLTLAVAVVEQVLAITLEVKMAVLVVLVLL